MRDDRQALQVRAHLLADARILQELVGRERTAADAHVVDVAAPGILVRHVICAAAYDERAVEQRGQCRGYGGIGVCRLQFPVNVQPACVPAALAPVDHIGDMVPHAVDERLQCSAVEHPVVAQSGVPIVRRPVPLVENEEVSVAFLGLRSHDIWISSARPGSFAAPALERHCRLAREVERGRGLQVLACRLALVQRDIPVVAFGDVHPFQVVPVPGNVRKSVLAERPIGQDVTRRCLEFVNGERPRRYPHAVELAVESQSVLRNSGEVQFTVL